VHVVCAVCVVERFAKVNDPADGAPGALTGINGSGGPTP